MGGSPEKIAQIAASRGIDSVAFTYNDPIVFAEYAIDTPKPAAHSASIPSP
ncbi:hypothetical protein PL702_05135 [Bifidobacterium breve]|uniref:hypothetical protein n=1 Tax=Bifidobacterium breve TaxID=1685 RepID=UPI00232C2F4F|nr:hypothetical protein [Bifidobacterium breve]MDB1166908.1 hypothetical protein [Bifidobacterium breve]MDB1168218.1 hypothetical protein [Bifidobacterium breve]MDB1175227.1 hypothetical protein [Bifidobacterium breve]MDB1178425.1 hypothetical protein [Bifidobacterium breve]MDU5958352.1 hypothetical protein [Bifidobacterium breve]